MEPFWFRSLPPEVCLRVLIFDAAFQTLLKEVSGINAVPTFSKLRKKYSVSRLKESDSMIKLCRTELKLAITKLKPEVKF